MIKTTTLLVATASLIALFTLPPSQGQTNAPAASAIPASGEIIKLVKGFDVSTLKTDKATASLVEQDGKAKLKLDFAEASPFPNVQFLKEGEVRDFSAFTGIQADVTNLGKDPLRVGIRADNAGDPSEKPWNTGGAMLAPGETQTIQIVFGKSWGNPGFALNPKGVTQVQIYGFGPAAGSAITISDLKAVK